MDTILAASDLSGRSDAALRRAAALAEAHGAALHAAHVVDDDLPEAMVAAQTEAARSHLAEVLGDAEAQLHVLSGDAAAVLPELADRIDADLLVVGPHRGRFLRDLVGSCTLERIVRASLRPCLVALSDASAPYAQVLCGVDLSPASASALRNARRLAPDAAIHAFHAVHAPHPRGLPPDAPNPFVTSAAADLATWIKTEDLPRGMTGPESFQGGVEGVLRTLLARDRPDLLALGAHGRGSLSPTHLGGFARDLIMDPPVDLLIVRR